MISLNANIPSLGTYEIRFHSESEEIVNFLEEKEFARLGEINHLGVASYVFTGTNHSRLEYLLLQCAIIEMLPRYHKGIESVSLAGKVTIPRQSRKISSGEELLKSWVLLSNSGHAEHTYGVERTLLNRASEDSEFRDFLNADLPTYLKDESDRIIDNYIDSEFHHLLALVRISRLPKGSRLKARLFRLMKVLICPIEHLETTDPSERFKLFRLRKLYERVRLISIVALDTYYSHHPIKFEVSSALVSLDSLFREPSVNTDFFRLLNNTAGWLADELYMHPRAAAAQKYYEVNSAKKLSIRLSSKKSSKHYNLYLNVMNSGFGKPNISKLVPLSRFTFLYTQSGPIFGQNVYELAQKLNDQISPTEADYVSVLLNPFTNRMHIDLLYDVHVANSSSIGTLCFRLNEWLSRHIEAQLIYRERRFRSSIVPVEDIRERIAERIRLGRLPINMIRPVENAMRSLLEGIINFLLPSTLESYYSEVFPSVRPNVVHTKIGILEGVYHNPLEDKLKILLDNNPNNLTVDRLHEIEMLRNYVTNSKAKTIIASTEQFVIRDKNGREIDDWDGVVVEIFDNQTTVTILEAKNTSPRTGRANSAFRQLKDTQKILKSNNKGQTSRRQRVEGFGAYLKLVL